MKVQETEIQYETDYTLLYRTEWSVSYAPQEKQLLNSSIGSTHYKWVGRIENYELNQLYNQAKCLVYPSVYEGFGIPPVEAQKAGCPVIAMNSSSLPEVLGQSGILLNELNAGKLNEVLHLLESSSVRDKYIMNGIKNSERFSWDLTFKKTMEVYKMFM